MSSHSIEGNVRNVFKNIQNNEGEKEVIHLLKMFTSICILESVNNQIKESRILYDHSKSPRGLFLILGGIEELIKLLKLWYLFGNLKDGEDLFSSRIKELQDHAKKFEKLNVINEISEPLEKKALLLILSYLGNRKKVNYIPKIQSRYFKELLGANSIGEALKLYREALLYVDFNMEELKCRNPKNISYDYGELLVFSENINRLFDQLLAWYGAHFTNTNTMLLFLFSKEYGLRKRQILTVNNQFVQTLRWSKDEYEKNNNIVNFVENIEAFSLSVLYAYSFKNV